MMKKLFLILSAAAVPSLLLSSCTELLPKGSDYVLQSVIEVEGRQGVATDGEFYYVSSSTALYKYAKSGELVMSNDSPFTELELPANHFGDIDVFGGEIYTGIETFMDGVGQNIQIAVYDAETLEYRYSIPWNPESGQVEVCGLAVDKERRRVWMADWVQGHELYCYDLDTKRYIGKTALEPSPKLQQGIVCVDSYILISSDDGNADLNHADHIWVCEPQIGKTVECMVWRTMKDFVREGEIEGLTFDPESRELVVLSNRGSRIVKGMVHGFYDGYDREIHELYVYGLK